MGTETRERRSHRSSPRRRKRDEKHHGHRKRKHKGDSRHKDHHRASSPLSAPGEKDQREIERVLEKGRVAMKALRELLGYQYDLKDEMKELIRQLDSGKRLDVSEIPDAYVLRKVCQVFDNINLIRRSHDGSYKGKYSDARIMDLLEPILEEKREDLEAIYQESVGARDTKSGEQKNVPKRAAGPMRPSLAESRQAEILMQQKFQEQHEDEGMTGPSLPDFPHEDLEESSDARLKIIGRIIKILQNHKAKRLIGKDKASIPPNPYEILDIDKSASSAEIKKKFLKLSLLIHPDKCDHPAAPTVFDAISTASKRLQDANERNIADKEMEQIQLTEIARALEKEKARENAWKVARGEISKEDLVPLRREREAWMTNVPTSGPLSHMSSQKQFKNRAAPPQDESWTRAPGEQSRIGPRPCVAGPMPVEAQSATQNDVDHPRRKSLMERHNETLNPSKGTGSITADVPGCGLVYRPFNKETDLELKKSVDPNELLKNIKGISGRFEKGSS